MDATTINPQLPARLVADATAQAFDQAISLPVSVVPGGVVRRYSASVEIFKKTPCAAGLSRAGRDVAKHMPEVDGIAFLSTTLLDCRGRMPMRAIAEKSNGVMWKPCQDVQRSADNSVASHGDVVGLAGIPGTARAALNLELTDKELAMRPSEAGARATNHTSTALWKGARQAPRAGGTVAAARQGLREAM